MKKQHKIILACIFAIAVLLLLTFIWPSEKSSAPKNTPATLEAYQKSINQSTETFFVPTQVSIHNKQTNCWVIIDDGVYDVTQVITTEKSLGDACGATAKDLISNTSYKDIQTAKDKLRSHRVGAIAPQYQ